MLDELKAKKLKNGSWEVWDSAGRKAIGATRKLAENQYYMKYQFSMPDVSLDMSKYMEELKDE